MPSNKNVSHQEMAEIIKEALVLKVTPLFENLKGVDAAEVVRDYFLKNTIHPHATFTFGQSVIKRKQSDDTNLFAKELTETMAMLVANNTIIFACGKEDNFFPFTEVLKLFCTKKAYKNSEKVPFVLIKTIEEKFLKLISGLGKKSTVSGIAGPINVYAFADGSFIYACNDKFYSETSFIYTRRSLCQMTEIYEPKPKQMNKVDITPYLKGMGEYQVEQIRLASKSGLNEEQIKVVANPDFDAQQMFQIRLACQLGLNMEQIEVIADPKLHWLQISELHQVFQSGLDIEEVKGIIKLGLDGVQIHELNLAYQSNLPEEQLRELRLRLKIEVPEETGSLEPKM